MVRVGIKKFRDLKIPGLRFKRQEQTITGQGTIFQKNQVSKFLYLEQINLNTLPVLRIKLHWLNLHLGIQIFFVKDQPQYFPEFQQYLDLFCCLGWLASCPHQKWGNLDLKRHICFWESINKVIYDIECAVLNLSSLETWVLKWSYQFLIHFLS